MTDSRTAIHLSLKEGNLYAAKSGMTRLLEESPNAATAQFITRCFRDFESGTLRKFRLAILRSFTLEPVIPILKAAALLNGIDLEVYLSNFNSYSQDILDSDSALYKFDPEAVILAIQTRDLVPDLWYRFSELSKAAVIEKVDEACAGFDGLIRQFRRRHGAYLLVHNLELPTWPNQGILDSQGNSGQYHAIKQINEGLTRICQQVSGAYVVDYDALICRFGRINWYDEQKWLSSRMPIAANCLGHLPIDYLRFLAPLSGRICKVLVLDLDNTLWGGVIGEEGIEGIKLGSEYPGAGFLEIQRAILDLYHRGILLAVCSKNNARDAMEVLENHPHMLLRPQHFAAMRINWEDKATNLRQIAAKLNIGTDAVAFLDDNPQERERVGRELPEVYVVDFFEDPMRVADLLRRCPVFERLSLSGEDGERARYYAQEKQRKDMQEQAASVEDFYRSLKMEIEIAAANSDSLFRIAQLTQKTNQFNLTTNRYNEQQIAKLLQTPGWRIYSLRASDKFGDSGIVGVAMTHASGNDVEIVNFLLSCRVIGRTIETAFLSYLVEEAIQQGAHRLCGWFIPTKKNDPAKDFYHSHGFSQISKQENGNTLWEFDLRKGKITNPEWIRRSVTNLCVHNS